MNKETNKLIPELRFPEFLDKGEWVIESLDKVVDDFIVPMRDKPKNLDGEIPWCRIEDFNGMYLSCSKSNQGVSLETVKEMNLKVYPVNTLLVSCSADLGRCAITQKPLVTNQTFIGLVPVIKKVNTVYLYYVMTNARNELNARSSGTTISYLSRQQFEKFEILLPKPNEQQKIASCLSSLDEVIAANSQKLEALKNHKKGLMQNIFPQEGETEPKFRFPDFVKDGEWTNLTLGEICKITSGGTPNRSESEFWNGDIPWVSTTLIDFNTINEVNEYITEVGLQNSSAKIFPKGTILMAMYGQGKTRGKVGILGIEAATNQACAAVLLKEGYNTDYVFQYLSAHYDDIRELSNKGGQENLSGGLIKIIPISIPNPKEQQKIADCLSSLDMLITVQAEKIEQLKLHKKGLMQGLFPKTIQ